MQRALTRADVEAAEAAIRPFVRETPVISTPAGDFGLAGLPLTFKLEFMQHSGTFKARGAFANLLMRTGAEAGVVAASGGNHGAAVAYAAKTLGTRARIFVPAISNPAKIAKIRSYGADVVVGGENYGAALEASEGWLASNGGLMVHAFDQFETLAGQGTVGLELERQAPDLDTLIIAVGGGGLIGGIAAAYEGRMRLIAVEPEGAPTLAYALAAGGPVNAPVGGIAADSLGASRIGAAVFPLAARHVEQVVLVTDDDIVAAQRAIWDTLRVVVEPGGAAAMAALLSRRYVPAADERVGILLCGANTTAVSFP